MLTLLHSKIEAGFWMPRPDHAHIIEDYISFRWTERFQDFGSFELTVETGGPVDSSIGRGDLITHTDTGIIMLVETINEASNLTGSQTQTVITGRSVESILQGSYAYDTLAPLTAGLVANPDKPGQYIQWARWHDTHTLTGKKYHRIASLLGHLALGSGGSSGGPLFKDAHGITDFGFGGPDLYKDITPTDNVYDVLLELLKLDGLGLKSSRWLEEYNPLPANIRFIRTPDANVRIFIYEPEDHSDVVTFYGLNDQIENLETIESDKEYYTKGWLIGKWGAVLADQQPNALSRYRQKIKIIQDSSIDEYLEDEPTTPERATITPIMWRRAMAEVSKAVAASKVRSYQLNALDASAPRYRADYNMGDLVTMHSVQGPEKVRVTEFTEVATPTSFESYPTVSSI